MIKRYLKIWIRLTAIAAQVAFISRFGALIFTLGKLLRFFLFLMFLFLISSRVKEIGGYNLWQMIFFFATFNLIDVTSQLLLREVYRFRTYVVSGDFDYFLTKPISPLFRALFGGSDILDFPMFILSILLVVVASMHIEGISLAGIVLYVSLVINGLMLAIAFHIFVLSIGILTTEIDHTIMIYRDITQMGRIPTDIYLQPIRNLITFVVPVGIMMTFPSKALMGLLSTFLIGLSFLIGLLSLYVSFKVWQLAIRRYSSASS